MGSSKTSSLQPPGYGAHLLMCSLIIWLEPFSILVSGGRNSRNISRLGTLRGKRSGCTFYVSRRQTGQRWSTLPAAAVGVVSSRWLQNGCRNMLLGLGLTSSCCPVAGVLVWAFELFRSMCQYLRICKKNLRLDGTISTREFAKKASAK